LTATEQDKPLRRITYQDLVRFIGQVLSAAGVPDQAARIEAEITAEVDLAGVHSHGLKLLPATIQAIRKGEVNPDPRLETVVDNGASVLYQTDRGIGRYISALAMDQAVERAQRFGIGAVAVRGVAHWGRGYSYAMRAAKAGCVGLAFTNATANFPAWGTSVPSLGNNPLAIGVPTGHGGEPVVLDLAMTQAAIRRVMDAAEAGETVPLGWGVDQAGQGTTDPRAILASQRFLPVGGHKGSGLAFMIELLTAGLAGGLLCFEQGTEGRPDDFAGGSSKLFLALQPFGPWLGSRTEALKSHLKSVAPAPEQGEARWPGEGSYRRKSDYKKRGIPLAGRLADIADRLSLEFRVPLVWL
jgi:LDH2 family malate/lactate/ureidoglycolate dehydrogenase